VEITNAKNLKEIPELAHSFMPRLARLNISDAPHHIIIQGIEGDQIFRDEFDRENLLKRLSDLLPETGTACYAWALLPDYAHFLMRSGQHGISHFMHRLLTGYAVYFNRRHRRKGRLFQNRYTSIVCQEDVYLKELVRYIHLNPIRAQIVHSIDALNQFAYSGHMALVGKQKNLAGYAVCAAYFR
jgi:REP element-mobilizing transposase RayT